MKYILTFLIWFTFIAILIGSATWEWYMHYQAKKTSSYILLADDASDPQVKADYLNKFLEKIKTKNLPKYAAFFFPTERESTEQQIKVIQSLIKRCEETASLPRESFGFAQGMTQITGQEFDHSLQKTYNIFNKLLCMKYGFFLYYLLLGVLLSSIVILPFNFILTSRLLNDY